MLEFVDSGLYLVQDENNSINPLLQVGSGFAEKSTGSGGQKINGSDRILIPDFQDMQDPKKSGYGSIKHLPCSSIVSAPSRGYPSNKDPDSSYDAVAINHTTSGYPVNG